ncbi:hypothetical protein BXZ70DRAFT_903629 [Cristinia sonorae]|uniref:Uncharacterized protein n=1 Tax=Cristinia sonorae TaxID=1940300 RepID=A0A8K0XU00_9AGAR|nr:hypothetical protein BXZ70DRAFT_903629 [Cristinia sonorae]
MDTTSPQLHRVDVEDKDTARAFSDILQSFLPYSLTVLGLLHNGDLNPANGRRNLQVWTSFPFQPGVPPPALFSAITYSRWQEEVWVQFFCSAEILQNPPTKDEEQHVTSFVHEFVRAVKTENAVVQGVDCAAVLARKPGGNGVNIGSLNNRWVDCLSPTSKPLENVYVKFVYRPDFDGEIPEWRTSEGEWEVTDVRESDLEFMNSRATFPRTREFLVGRLPYSVCIRRKGDDGPPVAWEMIYPDGGAGMLHVEEEFRGAGLARKCVAALSAKMAGMFREGAAGKYPRVRWEMTDVNVGNKAGLRLAGTRRGWKQTWLCHWMVIQ